MTFQHTQGLFVFFWGALVFGLGNRGLLIKGLSCFATHVPVAGPTPLHLLISTSYLFTWECKDHPYKGPPSSSHLSDPLCPWTSPAGSVEGSREGSIPHRVSTVQCTTASSTSAMGVPAMWLEYGEQWFIKKGHSESTHTYHQSQAYGVSTSGQPWERTRTKRSHLPSNLAVAWV